MIEKAIRSLLKELEYIRETLWCIGWDINRLNQTDDEGEEIKARLMKELNGEVYLLTLRIDRLISEIRYRNETKSITILVKDLPESVFDKLEGEDYD